MRIGVVGFTENGGRIAARLVRGLSRNGHEACGYVSASCFAKADSGAVPGLPAELKPLNEPVREWTARFFEEGMGIIFVGAAGIAVRSVAPYLVGKQRDPAVAVVDEKGRFAISLLSGHLGGANDLARLAASILGAEPVITTATDLNGVFAVDLFAKENRLAIADLPAAKRVSAALLRGETVGFFSRFPVEGILPEGLEPGVRHRENIVISVKRESGCLLVPRSVVLGVGCRKGIGMAAVREAAERALEMGEIHPLALAKIASIDMKKEEEGLIRYAEERRLPLAFFSAGELARAEGDFSESEFVRQITGVSNVCERAAVCGCAPYSGRLEVLRIALNGVTAAAAVEERAFCFSENGNRKESYIDGK